MQWKWLCADECTDRSPTLQGWLAALTLLPSHPCRAVSAWLILWASSHQNDSHLINSKTDVCLLPTAYTPIQPEIPIYNKDISGKKQPIRHTHTSPSDVTSTPSGNAKKTTCKRRNQSWSSPEPVLPTIPTVCPLWMFKFSPLRTRGESSLYLIW